jgi:hypothetical protein
VVDQSASLRIDPSRLAVVGDSVGGNMAAALTLIARVRRGPKIAFQVLFYPVTDADFDTASYTRFADGPWLTKRAMQWFWDAYLPDPAARKQPTATPLNASLHELAGLPEALVIVDENDVLRDEGEAYARRLSDAGVRVTSVRYNGTIHDFVMLNALADTPAVRLIASEWRDASEARPRLAWTIAAASNSAWPKPVCHGISSAPATAPSLRLTPSPGRGCTDGRRRREARRGRFRGGCAVRSTEKTAFPSVTFAETRPPVIEASTQAGRQWFSPAKPGFRRSVPQIKSRRRSCRPLCSPPCSGVTRRCRRV